MTQEQDTTNVSLYDFKGTTIRVFGTDETPWFVVKDIAEILGIQNHSDIVSGLDEDEKDSIDTIDTIGRSHKMTVISESAVYQMIFNSRKAEAKQFKKWVCKEVLPSIRQKGKYELEQKIKELEDKQKTLRIMTNKIKYIRLTHRLIHLKYVEQSVYNRVMKLSRHTINNRLCNVSHPDKRCFLKPLKEISEQMTMVKKTIDGVYPNVSQTDKVNIYTIDDYERFGDEVIHAYFEEHPFNTWGIDLNW